MAHANLIKRLVEHLAEHPDGVVEDVIEEEFSDAEIGEAFGAGLLKIDTVWAFGYYSLTDEGRRVAGLPPREIGPITRFFEDFMRASEDLGWAFWDSVFKLVRRAGRFAAGMVQRIADGLARR